MAVRNRHVPPAEVTAIRNRVRREGVTDTQLSATLGMSRVQLNQMFNGHQPMRMVYKYAIVGYLIMRKANASH